MLKNYLFLLIGFIVFHLTFGQSDPDPFRFSNEIAVFDSLDATNMPPKGCVLFIGSSSIRMWENAEKTFKKHNVINRGFGGSHTSDVIFFFDRLVKLYQPSNIVFYEGDNDIAARKSPTRVLNDFKKFVKKVNDELPNTSVAFISIKPSPSRWNLIEQIREANELIFSYCKENPKLSYIDIFEPMLGKDGKPKPKIFTSDSLHMNAKGYKIWKSEIKPFLD